MGSEQEVTRLLGRPIRLFKPPAERLEGFLVDAGSVLDHRPLDSGPQEVPDGAKLTFPDLTAF